MSPGTPWRAHIRDALGDCDAALILIGPNWLTVTDEHGGRRLDDPNDVLCFEVKQVLDRGSVCVIPVLFDAVRMPAAEELPESIRGLAEKQIYRWHSDQPSSLHLESLANAVTPGGGTPPPSGPEGYFSARVLELCDTLEKQTDDAAVRSELNRIRFALTRPVADRRGVQAVLGDADRADRGLNALTALSARSHVLRFIRNAVEDLRDSGPQIQMIEVARWYERALNGEVELGRRQLDEIDRLLMGRSLTERLGLGRRAARTQVRALVTDRVQAWTRLENGPSTPPQTQRLARAMEGFYERLDEWLEAQAELEGSVVNA